MIQVSVFHPPIQNTKKSYLTTLPDIFNKIKNDKAIEDKIKNLRSISDKKARDKFKVLNLEVITFSGIFTQRKNEFLKKHSSIICFDIDNLDEFKMHMAAVKLFSIKQKLVGYFVSPSGNGYKILIKINFEKFTQSDHYNAARNFLKSFIDIPLEAFDMSCKDVARACFISHDLYPYLNPLANNDEDFESIPVLDTESLLDAKPTDSNNSKNLYQEPLTFNPSLRDAKLDFNKKDDSINFNILLSKATQLVGEFKVGNRHNYIQRLSSLGNQFGMSKEAVVNYCTSHFKTSNSRSTKEDVFENEMLTTIDDIYERYKGQHGTWNKDEVEEEMETPLFPESLKQTLPSLIARPLSLFKAREADVFLLGFLGVLSSWIPKVGGFYSDALLSANLFFMISAPASSGKGTLVWTRKLTNTISETLLSAYKNALEEYEQALQLYEAEKKEDSTVVKPIKPLREKFIIAGNISSAALIAILNANKYFGMIFETEADTLSNTLNNREWGGFSDIIRKAFHNEAISYARKTNDEEIEITRSYLSMVLSGTPQQISRLVASTENGFFSRILFYSFPNTNIWKDVFEKKDENLEKYFEAYSIKLEKLLAPFFYNKSKNIDDTILFSFTEIQRSRFNTWFENKQKDLSQIYGDDIIASVRRLGVCFFRVAMILSVMRTIESYQEDPHIYGKATSICCVDDDYNNAEQIIEVLIFHTIRIYKQIKKRNRNKYSKGKKTLLLEHLPIEFDRARAMELAAYIGIKEKTAENYLTVFINTGDLIRAEHNHYKKPF